MPHKHKLERDSDKTQFELPPSVLAQALPVSRRPKPNPPSSKDVPLPLKRRKKPSKTSTNDDTPRAFARLMAFTRGQKPPSGLDDGIKPSKKRKRATTTTDPPAAIPVVPAPQVPRILPGERMADYSQRVDAALPVAGLVGRGAKKAKDLPGVKVQRTKMERKMHRMYDEWREVEKRRKEKAEEEKEDKEYEEQGDGGRVDAMGSGRKGKKGKRRRGPAGEEGGDEDEDPWAAVGRKPESGVAAGKGLVGLHDVVQAPPQLKAPKAKLRALHGAGADVLDVLGAAGSLRRREELGAARRGVVEGYRAMMRERRAAVGA